MTDLHYFDSNQLLTAFLDACRDDDRNAAIDAIHELRYRVWAGSPLPRDPRTSREETRRLFAASVALAQCRDALNAALDGKISNQTYEALVSARVALGA